jgi:hypothetical protein
MAHFRILPPSFWTQNSINSMKSENKLVLSCLLTCAKSCKETEIGIFPMLRGELAFNLGLDTERVSKIIDELINNYPKQISFKNDHDQHFFFLKKFFEYNIPAMEGSKKICEAIHKDFKKSGYLCPDFWAEFSKINKYHLKKAYEGLTKSDNNTPSLRKTLDKIFKLEEEFYPKNEQKPKSQIKITQIKTFHADQNF